MKAKICLILIGWIGEGGHVEVMSTLIMVSTCFVQICRNVLIPKVLFRHSYQHHVDLYVVQSTRTINQFL